MRRVLSRHYPAGGGRFHYTSDCAGDASHGIRGPMGSFNRCDWSGRSSPMR